MVTCTKRHTGACLCLTTMAFILAFTLGKDEEYVADEKIIDCATDPPAINFSSRCFSICNHMDVANWYARLPTAVDRRSPWFSYLQDIYGSNVTCPFHIRDLELFYISRLPFRACGEAQNGSCNEWLLPFPDPLEMNVMHRRTFKVYPSSHNPVVFLQRPFTERNVSLNEKWVEIYRTAYPGEGNGYGCWAHPARGSGIHVFWRAALVIDTHTNAIRTLGYTACPQAYFWGRAIAKETGGFCIGDFMWAHEATVRGYDAVRILSNNRGDGWYTFQQGAQELIIAMPQCRHGPGTIRHCLPVPVRTGWSGSLPATCNNHQAFPSYLYSTSLAISPVPRIASIVHLRAP